MESNASHGIKNVKQEQCKALNLVGGIHVKVDPESNTLSPELSWEDDVYEDAGDVDFDQSAQEVYLSRIPKFLWKTWSQMDDDQEICIGTIRVEAQAGVVKRMSLLLSSAISINETVPKEYNMQITNQDTANTFIFSEKDLLGYTNRPKGTARQSQENTLLPLSQAHSRSQHHDRPLRASSRIDKTKKWQPYYRKAIPKKTAVLGHVRTEVNCLPVENDEYKRVMDERANQALKPKKETQFLTGLVSSHAGNLLAPGTLGSPGNFNTFIKTTGQTRGKPQESKAARMPQNELLDLIVDCFKRYNYWSLKTLKAHLNQPEAYLKQTLEMVAQLVRQGPHAMKWQLKPESKLSAYANIQSYAQAEDDTAPEIAYTFDGPSDIGEPGEDHGSDDDEDVKLEDVMLI